MKKWDVRESFNYFINIIILVPLNSYDFFSLPLQFIYNI